MDLNFDTTNYEPTTGDFSPLKEGEYLAVIKEIEQLENKDANTGYHLKITLNLPDVDRKVFDRLNLWHKKWDNEKGAFVENEKTCKIAKDQLFRILQACGIEKLKSTDELLDCECVVVLGVREYNDKKYNEVKKYLPYTSQSEEQINKAVASVTSNQAPPQAATNERMPWDPEDA